MTLDKENITHWVWPAFLLLTSFAFVFFLSAQPTEESSFLIAVFDLETEFLEQIRDILNSGGQIVDSTRYDNVQVVIPLENVSPLVVVDQLYKNGAWLVIDFGKLQSCLDLLNNFIP